MSLWSCTSCSKSFTRKGDLTRHELLHTGIKPHVCETCGKGFAQFSGLKTHRNVHSKAKPYICGIGTCKKAFGDPSSRARHKKETHRREGAYKCIITDCGTRIKRRSVFVAHLRRHGLDPSPLDINAIVLYSSERGSAPTHLVSPDVENKSKYKIQSRSVSPSFLSDHSEYLANGAEASYFMDEWLGDHPLDCRRVNLSLANDTLFSMLDQTANVGPGILHNVYPYPSSECQNSFYFDDTFPEAMNYPLLSSPLSLPALEPFLEPGIDGSRSSWSSPSSTCSILNTTDSDNDVGSLGSLLYNIGPASLSRHSPPLL